MEQKQPQYYTVFDTTGNIAGFYVDEIHGDAIPKTAIPITEEEWQTYSAAPHRYKLDGDTIREKTPEEIEAERAQRPPAPSMEQRLNAVEDMLLGILLGGV